MQLPPQNIEAEQSVLGSILLSNQSIYKIDLESGDFYKPEHARLFSLLRRMIEKGNPADIVTVNNALKKVGKIEAVGGTVYLSQLLDIVPTAANIRYYANIVKNASIRRKIQSVAQEMLQKASDGEEKIESILGEIEQSVYSISAGRSFDDIKFLNYTDLIKRAVREIEVLTDSNASFSGLPTGINALDKIIGGLNKTDLIIIGGRPSMGKTAFAGNIAENLCRAGKTVAVFSIEMSGVQLCKRQISSAAQVNGKKFRVGGVTDMDWSSITSAIGDMAEYKLLINDNPGMSLRKIRSALIRAQSSTPVDLVIVDYLQLMETEGNGRNRDSEVGSLSTGLKGIAKMLDVPVIALAQLNRDVEKRENKRPVLSDLRESGRVEQDGDVIMFLYREKVYNPNTDKPDEAEILVRKNRHGPCRGVRVRFIEEYSQFKNWME